MLIPKKRDLARNVPEATALGKLRFTHQVFVDAAGGVAALLDGADHERLAGGHVAGGENAFAARHVVFVDLHIAARIQIHAQLFDHSVLNGMNESHGQENKLGVDGKFGAGNCNHLKLALLVFLPLDAHAVQLADLAVLAGKTFS